MGKQTKPKKAPNVGKGKVTQVQIAFIVDRYLSDNNFSETRSVFRSEASSFISKSPVREAPKGLLSLETMLNEYIGLKEHKVILDQEKACLDKEKLRVQSLLQGMQDAMNAYNASSNVPAPMIPAPASAATKPVAVVPQSNPTGGYPPDPPLSNAPAVMHLSLPSNNIRPEPANLSSVRQSVPRKRKGSEVCPQVPPAARHTRSKAPTQFTSEVPTSFNEVNAEVSAQPSVVAQSLTKNDAPDASLVEGFRAAKSNQPSLSPAANSTCPQTPPQAVSSQNDKSMSPLGVSSTANCSYNNTPQEITPTNCTVISTERIRVSPLKRMGCYTMERTHCISSTSPAKTNSKRLSKRDHVKGRLDFDGSGVIVNSDRPTTNEIPKSVSEKETDIFDMDLLNLDAFGEDFSFSDLLTDLDLDCEGIGCPCQLLPDHPVDTGPGSSPESRDGNLPSDKFVSEYSSTVTKLISGKDKNIEGSDSLTAMKSVTKCIRILSPAKGLKQENNLTSN